MVTGSHTGATHSTTAERAALGFALGARAPDAVKAVLRAIESHTVTGTDLALTSDSTLVGTLLIARWLVTGEPASESDMAYLAGIGNVSFEHGNSIAAAAIGTMTWRDFLVRVLKEEGARLESSRQLIAEAITVVHRSCDADVVRFSRTYDARMTGLNDALVHQALHDGLTGLPNRTMFMDRLAHELKAIKRRKPGPATSSAVCVAAIDLDYLKIYNDTLGHQAGDQLLVAVSEAWLGCLREVDHLARLGGDEFVLLLPDCGIDDARDVVQRMHNAMPRGQTCSAGVAEWNGTEAADALLGRADAALYATKRSGRAATSLSEAAGGQKARPERGLLSVLDAGDIAITFLPVSLASDGVQVGWKGALLSKIQSRASSAELRLRADREACLQRWDWTERVRAINASASLPPPNNVFVDYDIHSWLDPGLGIEQFRLLLGEARLEPAAVVLCLAGYLPGRDTDRLLEVAADYREAGVRLCLTPGVLAGITLGLAARLRPEFVEVPLAGGAKGGVAIPSSTSMLAMVQALGASPVTIGVATAFSAADRSRP